MTDILRFIGVSKLAIASRDAADMTLDEFLQAQGLAGLRENYLLPMVAAIWSCSVLRQVNSRSVFSQVLSESWSTRHQESSSVVCTERRVAQLHQTDDSRFADRIRLSCPGPFGDRDETSITSRPVRTPNALTK